MNSHRKINTCCALCECCNLASICPLCVNYRLNVYNSNLKSLKSKRDALYARLSEALLRKGKADDQKNWLLLRREKLARMKEKLQLRQAHVLQGNAKIEKMSRDVKVKFELLDSAMAVLKKNRVEQLEKFYPNLICTQTLGHMAITSERLHKQSVIVKQICKLYPLRRVIVNGERKDDEQKDGFIGQYDSICGACLPRGLDPHSVPCEQLAASMGYMVQLLDLIVQNVCGPALHNSGFAGSCSRIWQRDSYSDARPSSRSSEYPLFIPRQKFCSTGGEASWSDKNSSTFGVASMESDKKLNLDSSQRGSFNFSSASQHSIERHKDVQKGIALLKKSVACITAYCYNSLSLEVPAEASTFEAFSKLLSTLASSKEVRSVVSLKMASSRSSKQAQQFYKSVWKVDSAISSSTLAESGVSLPMARNTFERNAPSSTSFLAELYDTGKAESSIEGWDIVEHPKYPPPPSHTEDVEHWARAMFVDATKKNKK